ncbi:MAG: NAD(P)-dependent oxidoreductase [Nostoc sp. NOS(2021)]|uniref:NAD-dependent epimerase/dehydratase family protein n=1 Tax=Nostoc sp. NOS(2021) TaxID=2815407 RepID=UPI0025F65AC6|nr:NAD(P)-dependent oxidoreductase [Nostoc sp. NOS(2021)]MBN3894907.1 NAD(P)-dependent oxidoreductase [Nostoc sp. NOS(2021)]
MSIVWITGARGFIGRNLSKHLAKQENKVLGVGHGAWPPEISTNFGVSYWINGEIDDSNLRQLFDKSGRPDMIYHLAGGSSVGLSIQVPAEDFRRSVSTTAALLEWIRGNVPETKLVVSSSAAIYGNAQMDAITEDGYFMPYSPYGFHKRAAELLCQSYAHNFGLQIAIVRLFSVYGPGLYKQLLWELCCRLRQSPSILKLHGTGYEIRDWLYVEDAVRILIGAANSASYAPFIVNGGTGIGTCVRDVTTLLCQAWGQSPELQFSGKHRVGDPFSLVADTQRLQTLEFIPKHKLALGLEEYVRWFQQMEQSKSLIS